MRTRYNGVIDKPFIHYTYVRRSKGEGQRHKGQGQGSRTPKCAGLEGESGHQSHNMAICFKAPIGGCGRVVRVPELKGQVGQLFRAGRGKVGIDYHVLDRIFSGRAQASRMSALIFYFYCFFSAFNRKYKLLRIDYQGYA